MDINNQVETIVNNLVKQIEDRLNAQVDRLISDKISARIDNFDLDSKVGLLASLKLDNKIKSLEVRPVDVERKLKDASDKILDGLNDQAKKQITAEIARRIGIIDFDRSITNAVAQQLELRLDTVQFPPSSIPFDAIKRDEIHLTGNFIKGGIIENFGSTGIDDRATTCKVTVMDDFTAVENKLVTVEAEVRGPLTIEGDLVLKGQINTDGQGFKNIVDNTKLAVLNSMDSDLFTGYSNLIFDRFLKEGLDLNKITVNGNEVIVGNKIGYNIIDSNLQRVGMLRDLQTTGETLLGDGTLYVTKGRFGVNTIDPGHAASLWDQEVEFVFTKKKQDTAQIGTVRNQTLIVSSNNKNNLICNTDGSVTINNFNLGPINMQTSDNTPTDNQPRGVIVWNTQPEIGQPIGWVSLGGARWANFGIISV